MIHKHASYARTVRLSGVGVFLCLKLFLNVFFFRERVRVQTRASRLYSRRAGMRSSDTHRPVVNKRNNFVER